MQKLRHTTRGISKTTATYRTSRCSLDWVKNVTKNIPSRSRVNAKDENTQRQQATTWLVGYFNSYRLGITILDMVQSWVLQGVFITQNGLRAELSWAGSLSYTARSVITWKLCISGTRTSYIICVLNKEYSEESPRINKNKKNVYFMREMSSCL